MTQDFDPQKRSELLDLLQANRKLEAVKRYREWTRSSLLDAKNAVEQLQETGTLHWPQTEGESLDDAAMDEVLEAIERGQKIEACKLYRGHAGCTLKEAKEFVESLMGELGHSSKAGCLVVLLAALLVTATAVTLA
ncbi:MAG: hypothetical protein AAFX06_11815 [Planctomycetota bacterium]